MSKMVPVNFRVLPTERDAWKQQAEKEGVSLTELVRRTMNAQLGGEKIVTAAGVQEKSHLDQVLEKIPVRPVMPLGALPGPSFSRPRRTETCEHRLAPETFCRWCDG